jgi:ABC-type nitrate/sulfonate/bicarbonate transport system permease component
VIKAMSTPAPDLGTPVGTLRVFLPRLRKLFVMLLPFLFLAAVWQIVAYTQPPYIFPSLGKILLTIADFHEEGILISASLVTLKSVVIGSVLSIIVGTLVGFALARYESFTGPLLNFAQTVPYVVWALMSLIWFGLTQASVVFTIFVAAFPVVSFNVAAGLKNVEPHLLGMAQSVRANKYMVLRHIVFPGLTPYLLSASRTMLGVAWKICVLAELFAGGAGGGGVGYNLFVGWEFNRTGEVFGWTLWLVLLMMLSEWLIVKPIEHFATRWKTA